MKAIQSNIIFFICRFVILLLFSCTEEDQGGPPQPPAPPPSINNGLVGFYSFEGNADDLSGHNFHGSVNGATPTANRHGSPNAAYRFDGKDDYISLGNVEEMSFGGFEDYTLAAWVQPAMGEGGTNIIVSKWNGGVLAGWYLAVTPEGNAISYRNVVPWTARSAVSISSGEFVHLITSYDGEKRELYLYINGVLAETAPFTSQPHDRQTPVLIGALHSRHDVSGFYEGVIDEVRIYDRLLSSEEITYLAEN